MSNSVGTLYKHACAVRDLIAFFKHLTSLFLECGNPVVIVSVVSLNESALNIVPRSDFAVY